METANIDYTKIYVDYTKKILFNEFTPTTKKWLLYYKDKEDVLLSCPDIKEVIDLTADALDQIKFKQAFGIGKDLKLFHKTFPWIYPETSYCALGALAVTDKNSKITDRILNKIAENDIFQLILRLNDYEQLSFKQIAQELRNIKIYLSNV